MRVHYSTTPHDSWQTLDSEEGRGEFVHDMIASPIQRRSPLSESPTSIYCRCFRVQVSRNGYRLAISPNRGGHKHTIHQHTDNIQNYPTNAFIWLTWALPTMTPISGLANIITLDLTTYLSQSVSTTLTVNWPIYSGPSS